ncbi:MAG: enoyl-CoA hydratase/isomerase family protein [Clostridiales Family XIII bacterium]|jgi:enoyl-CoA hydratase|nr:enoyl-CoA hydratase/isomerase family protein [Clostridiales Family XIII bacterium]
MYKNSVVECKLSDGIAVVTIDNPPMNPLCKDAIDGLRDSFNLLLKEDSVRAVILTGAGEKAFVAGADIKEFPTWTQDMAEDLAEKGQRIFSQIENFPAPVIAAINGFALGGGLELALSCDIRIASENARMGLPEVSLGIIPGYGGTQRLSRTINPGDAKRMIYTAEMIKADKALQLGLVQEVLPLASLMDKAFEIAKKICANAPIAVRGTKRAVNSERNMTIAQGLAEELAVTRQVFGSEDKKEGVDAFINKRKADFKNR